MNEITRGYNCTTNEQDLWVKYHSDAGLDVNVSWHNDPNNPNRGTISFDTLVVEVGGGLLSASKEGFSIWSVRVNVPPPGVVEELGLHSDPLNAVIEIKAGTNPFPSGVVKRDPLPSFPPNVLDPSTVFDSTLLIQPPPLADKKYWRCNFGGRILPGIGPVDGSSPLRPDEVLTGFLGRYPVDKQKVIIADSRACGITHMLRWVQDEQSVLGFSIQKYVDECKRVKDGGVPFIAHSFLSKVYSPRNPDRKYLRDTFGALIEACLKANVLDINIIGFELTEVSTGDLFDLIDYFCTEMGLNEGNGIDAYVHHISGYTWPGVGFPDRRQWWQAACGLLTGLLYQCDPSWPISEAQGRYRDTTDNAGEGFPGLVTFGHAPIFVVLETLLEREFNTPTGAEPDGDYLEMFGYLSLCTRGQVPVSGFGCGARRPDGTYL